MALIDVLNNLDDRTVLNIIRKGLYVNIPDPKDAARKGAELSKKDLANISNSLTSLQGAFNQIYASTLNIRNIQQYQQKSFLGVQKENRLEATQNISSTMNMGQPSDDNVAALLNSISEVSYNVDLLATKLRKINIGGDGGVSGIIENIVEAVDDVTDVASVSGGGSKAFGTLTKLPWKKIGVGAAVVGGVGMAGMASPASAAERQPSIEPRNLESTINKTQEQIEKSKPQQTPTGPSYSEKFADFLDRTVENVTGWVKSAGAFLGITGDSGGGMVGGYSGPLSGDTRADFQTIVDIASRAGAPHPEIVAAQWALESGYGKSMSGKNNPFGQKAGPNEDATIRTTQEYVNGNYVTTQARFKNYASLEEAIAEHVRKWNASHTKAGSSPLEAIQSIYAKGYATDPQYVTKITRILANNNIDPNSPYSYSSSSGGSYNIGKGAASQYGWRTNPVTKERQFHGGVDIPAPQGVTVHAYRAGTVTFAGNNGSYGNVVYIKHDDGTETRYAHLSSIAVASGSVVQGGIIGRVGSTGRSTGPHLHFEFLNSNGEKLNSTGIFNANRWIVGGNKIPEAGRANSGAAISTKTRQIKNFGVAVPFKRSGGVTDFIRRRGQDQFEIKNSAGLEWTPITTDDVRAYGRSHDIDMKKYFGI